MDAQKSLAAGQLVGSPPHLPVTYHQQNRDAANTTDAKLYCGAAAAQMVLDSIYPAGTALFDQEVLYNSNHDDSIEGGWDSSPNGLAKTMDTLKPTTFTTPFKLCELQSVDSISRKICWAIHHHGVAPIVSVFGDKHWIVVTGFTATAAPTSSTDTAYTIKSFDIHDPWPLTPENGGPPPHGNGSDNCGVGPNRGTPHYTIAYAKDPMIYASKYWPLDYMTPVLGGHWNEKFLAVCDPDTPAATLDPPMQFEGGLVTDPNEIVGRANQGLEDFGLSGRGPWRAALTQASPSDPILVERVDVDPPRPYYLVPYLISDGGWVPIVVRVDAEPSGAFSSSIAAPEQSMTLFAQPLDRDTFLQDILGKTIDLRGTTFPLLEEELYEPLVWQPCAESLSPYWPFYRFDVGGPDSQNRVYVRIDGKIFTELRVGKGM